MCVNYDRLIRYNVEAITEQQTLIEDLQKTDYEIKKDSEGEID
jgi:hypothetical protein